MVIQPMFKSCKSFRGFNINKIYFFNPVLHCTVIIAVTRHPPLIAAERHSSICCNARATTCFKQIETMKITNSLPAISSVHKIPGKMCRVLIFNIYCLCSTCTINLVGKIIANSCCLSTTGTILIKYRPEIWKFGIINHPWQYCSFTIKITLRKFQFRN